MSQNPNSKRENIVTIATTAILSLTPALPDYLKGWGVLSAVIIVIAFIVSETYLRKIKK
jgi:uncharacterized membrane protein YjfL (UPF0719 family)